MASQYFRFLANGADEPRRSALLERLAARADVVRPSNDWRAEAFRVIAPHVVLAPTVAAATLFEDCGPVEGAWACIATPVRYVAEMSSVRLPQGGILSLTPQRVDALAADFNRIWAGSGVRMLPGAPAPGASAPGASAPGASARLYCIFDEIKNVTTCDPQEVLGQNIEAYLPSGTDAPRLRQLMSEIEMWLFEQAGNRADLSRINAFWLWGGGMPLESLPNVTGWFAGDDLYFSALSRGSSNIEKSGSGVIVTSKMPQSAGWDEIESWLRNALVQLRARRISQLEVSGGGHCISLSARALTRFWRRRKPWWESFA